MKKMNKILAILLALTMVFALAACGGDKDGGSDKGGTQTNDNPYNLDYKSADLQPMSSERASKEALLEATEFYTTNMSDTSKELNKKTYADVAELIGVDASEFQYFESYSQYRYTWYLEGNDGPALLVVFNSVDGTFYSASSSIS